MLSEQVLFFALYRRRNGWFWWGKRSQPKAPTKTTQPPTSSRHSQSASGLDITMRPHPKPKNLFDSFIDKYQSSKFIIQLAFKLKTCPGVESLLDDILQCGRSNQKTYLRKANMITVLKKKVVKLQIIERPMGHCGLKYSKSYGRFTISCLQSQFLIKTSISGKKDRVMHSGMVVETEDHKKYLIHKGKQLEGQQAGNQKTVIEVARDAMFKREYTKVGRSVKPRKLRSVREYYDESGSDYNFVVDNCHDGTLRMLELANKP